MQREFGIELVAEKIKHWSPPDVGIPGIAKAAAGIPGRENFDLTLVCIGRRRPLPTAKSAATFWATHTCSPTSPSPR